MAISVAAAGLTEMLLIINNHCVGRCADWAVTPVLTCAHRPKISMPFHDDYRGSSVGCPHIDLIT
jgi:hypothetical protein